MESPSLMTKLLLLSNKAGISVYPNISARDFELLDK